MLQSKIQLVSLENSVENCKVTQLFAIVEEQCSQAFLKNAADVSDFSEHGISRYLFEQKLFQSFPLIDVLKDAEKRIIGRKQFHCSLPFNFQLQKKRSEYFKWGFLHKRPQVFFHRYRGVILLQIVSHCGSAQYFATETTEHAGGENELSGHPQFCIPQAPSVPGLSSLLVDEIDGNRSPIADDIVHQDAGNFEGKASVVETPIVLQISAENVFQGSCMCVGFAKRLGLLDLQHSACRIFVCVLSPADLLHEVVAESHTSEDAASSRRREVFLFQPRSDFLCYWQMFGFEGAVSFRTQEFIKQTTVGIQDGPSKGGAAVGM